MYNKCKSCEATIEEGKELCDFCLNLAQQKSEETKVVKKVKYNPLPKPLYIELVCSKCGKKESVRVTHPELYTEEKKKNWTCFLHTTFKKKGDQNGTPSISQ